MHTATKTSQGHQRGILERLGFSAGTRLLIVHADDLGMSHSMNQASFMGMELGVITSGSVMTPCPWFQEVASYAKQHTDADIGVHLTLTSEWNCYRWRPVAALDRVPSLVDELGYFPTKFSPDSNLKEIELEARAQLNLAIRAGIRPTHVDSHMGALYQSPELYVLFERLAKDFSLPLLSMKRQTSLITSDAAIFLDDVIIIHDQVKSEDWNTYYANAIRRATFEVCELIVHPGFDNEELRAITAGHANWNAAWRQRDFDALTSSEFNQALRDNSVTLIGWRDLQRLVPQKPEPLQYSINADTRDVREG